MMAEGIKGATDHRSTYGEKLDIEGGRGWGKGNISSAGNS
jgi:hypothetical protein